MANDAPVQKTSARHAAPPADIILRASHVSKRYGGLQAVDAMLIDVPRGGLVGLIGPNGAGKSTFFDLITGHQRADQATIWFDGRRIDGKAMHRVARAGLVRTFQIVRPLARMTVLENLMLAPARQPGEHLAGSLMWWRTRRQDAIIRERAMATLDFFDLAPLADEYAGALSGGQKKLLELARAIMLEPKMLMLDEPMAGVNPTLAAKLMDRIQTLRRERGVTFLLVEHDMDTVFNHCERVVVMAQGRPLAAGTPEEVRNDPIVQDAYLGG